VAAGVAGATVRGALRAIGDEGQPETPWARQNYHGRTVDLRGGPAMVAGLLAGSGALERHQLAAGVVAIGAAGGAGLFDDLRGDAQAKGLRGHLGALKAGRVTTGLIKLGVIGAGALAAAALEDARRGSGRAARLGLTLVDAALIAGSANLVNLLDLRPGRALKAAALPAAVLALKPGEGGPLAAGAVAAIGAALPADLEERTMLGDAGANALGAAIGLAAVRSLTPAGRAAALAGVTGLIFASEKVSFSRVIAGHPLLARWDAIGRLPGEA
jgi:UDP-N-acetylmuramyl pentapeptide phosphotransferase/UDP-N-acetylglucosamine-1-phosphate transferase